MIVGHDDLYPTKMDYVNDVNRELREQVRHIKFIQEQLEKIDVEGSPLQKIANDLKLAFDGLERWALGRVLGEEQNRGFLSFRDGEIIVDHNNFLYFKITPRFLSGRERFANQDRNAGLFLFLKPHKIVLKIPLAFIVVYMLHFEMWKLNLGVFASMKLKTVKGPLKNGSKT